jgi:hypothetical protein
MKSRIHHKQIRHLAPLAIVGSLLVALAGMKATDAAAAPTAYTFEPLAFLGDPAPGTGGGTLVNDFEPTHINNRGEVAFTADVDLNGETGEGVFVARQGTLTPIMHSFQPAPGGGTLGPAEFDYIGLNEPGDLAITFSLEPFPVGLLPTGGVYRYSPETGQLTAVAIPGTALPGGGMVVGIQGGASINNQGVIAFSVFDSRGPVTPFTGVGLFLADKRNHLTTVADPADGIIDWAGVPWLNDQGDVAFAASLTTDSTFVNRIFVRKAGTSQPVPVAEPGDISDQGEVLRSPFFPRINDAGQVAFCDPQDTDRPIGLSVLHGIFLYSSGIIQHVAAPGDAMPSGGHISILPVIDWQTGLNNRGDVGFFAALDTGDEGLYLWSGGEAALVAKTGTVLPGVGTIANLEYPGNLQPVGQPTCGAQLNDHGQIAFGCTLTDGRTVLLRATPHGAE